MKYNTICYARFTNHIIGTQAYEIQQFVKSKDNCPLGLVVSVLDYNDLASSGVMNPGEWKEKGIKHLIVPIPDFSADINDECIIAAVYSIKEAIHAGESVYVHCKAGRSRSAMLCLIYLAVYGDEKFKRMSVEDIENYLISKRPLVGLMTQVERISLISVAYWLTVLFFFQLCNKFS